MIYFFSLFTILVICSLRKKKEGDVILDKNATTSLKGIMCIYILLHNLGLDYQGNGEVARLICDHSGTVAVSVFFFLSGFGVLTGYLKYGNAFLKKLLTQNVAKLFLISVGINLLIYFTFFKGQFETKDLLLKIFNLDFFNHFSRMNRHGWFIPTIITLYFLFSIILFLFSKIKCKNNILIGVFLVAFITVAVKVYTIFFTEGSMYTKGLPCFGLGLLYAYFKKDVDKFAEKYCWLVVGTGLAISAVSFIFFWGTTAGYLINAVIVAISTKYRYDNKVILFIGKISIGIYLFLYYSTLLLQKYVDNQYHWVLLNTLLIFALSVALHFIMVAINKIKKIFGQKIKTAFTPSER